MKEIQGWVDSIHEQEDYLVELGFDVLIDVEIHSPDVVKDLSGFIEFVGKAQSLNATIIYYTEDLSKNYGTPFGTPYWYVFENRDGVIIGWRVDMRQNSWSRVGW